MSGGVEGEGYGWEKGEVIVGRGEDYDRERRRF